MELQRQRSVSKLHTEITKQRVVCLFFQNSQGRGEPSQIEKIAEACYRFSPQIAIRTGEAIFLEIGRCRTLYTEDGLLFRLQALMRRFGVSPRIVFADDPCSALALARNQAQSTLQLSIDALGDFADPFINDAEMLKQVHSVVHLLKMLGIKTLGDFIKVPAKSLASRFGYRGSDLIFKVHQSIAGSLSIPWPSYKFREKLSERIFLHDSAEFLSCNEIESLIFILKPLCDRITARLRGRSKRATALRIDLKTSGGLKEKRSWKIEFPIPQGSTLGILAIIKLKLEYDLSREPLDGAVTEARLTVEETAPGHGAQQNLFNTLENSAEEWDTLIGRLCQRLGKESAFLANPVDRYLPEAAWTKSIDTSVLTGTFTGKAIRRKRADRPSRVLKKAEPLRKLDQNTYGSITGKNWQITEWGSPEKISGEWWWDPRFRGFAREYYRVRTSEGSALWVFKTANDSTLYLHGFFD